MDRLHRTRMLVGDGAIEKLARAHVMIVGCGAVGSFATEALARTGIGHITLIDSDVIEESNINRQLFALDSTVGLPKVTVAAARIHDINPTIRVDGLQIFFDANTHLDCTPDFVIDAIDTVESKIALYKWCSQRNIPFISSMGAARKTDASQIKIAPISQTSVGPLAARIRRAVRDNNIPEFDVVYSDECPDKNTADNGRTFGSVITITGIFGLLAANYCIQKLIK